MTGQIFDIGKIAYEGPDSKNPFAFQFYNKDEVIAGKKMSEHLKFSMAYWHTLVADGTDMFGVGTTDKSFGESDPLALAKKKVYAAFELMDKLGIEYFCFHDRDIAPEGKNLAEFQKNLDCIVPLIKEQMQTYGIKLLWGTANCFASPKYMHGAATSCSAEAFACAAVGCGVVSERTAFTTIGTSGVVYAHTDRPVIDQKGRIHTFCCAVPGAWHVMGVTQAAGLSLKWFKNLFAAELSYAELDRLCKAVPIGAEKLVYLPYLMGERTPILDDSARGVFFGLSAMHTRAHMARAVMEGVSYSLKDCLDVLTEVGVSFEQMAVCGGGAKGAFWRGMIADVFGMPVTLMQSEESAVLGAAILAGTASGVFADVREGCKKMTKTGGIQPCNLENHASYENVYRIYRALYPALKQNFRELAML